ncbi:MAG: T9SS type A sorting domain-containing protein [Gemmatimonadaceae bacterium]|nr:T9SS type A sorting domain-containing protein [Chitinophagaceae bacterium]
MKTLSILLISIFMLGLQSQSSAGIGHPENRTDTIVISKSQISKKYKVKIFPSSSNEVIFFTASGESGKVYQLFVFDMEGKLIKQTQIRNKETTLLTNFNKGSYTFEVFSDDERIENGTMEVR